VRSARRPRRHIFIDIRPRLRYHPHRTPACEGRRPATPADGAGAVPAGAGSSPALPGGFGATPGRHYDRPARSSLGWDRKLRVPGSASGAELRRWLAAASAAVERRQAARRVDFVCADLRTLVCVDARRAPSSVLPRTRGRMKVGRGGWRYASAGVPPPFPFVARMNEVKSGVGVASRAIVPGFRCASPGVQMLIRATDRTLLHVIMATPVPPPA
jgi:hypothetical protein